MIETIFWLGVCCGISGLAVGGGMLFLLAACWMMGIL
jgi:hypothetical protein